MSKLVDINELYRPATQKFKDRQKIFDQVLESCHNKIKQVSQFSQECYFTVPRFIIGVPPYDYRELVQHLHESLQQNGLYSAFSPPDRLYISWRPEHVDYEQFQRKRDELRQREAKQQPAPVAPTAVSDHVSVVKYDRYGDVPVNPRRLPSKTSTYPFTPFRY